jgi:hypothetical protein
MATSPITTARSDQSERTALIRAVVTALGDVIVGKTQQLRQCVACLLARGH